MDGDVEPIRIVAAVIADDEGRVLLVRKRGSTVFIQPGGKREGGEHAAATLRRELAEELGVEVVAGSMRTLGQFEDSAVNEPGRRVRADAYALEIAGEPRPGAEIEEIAWLSPQPPYAVAVAPLSARHVLPAWRFHAADPDARRRQDAGPRRTPALPGSLQLAPLGSAPAAASLSISPLASLPALPPLPPLPLE